MKFQTMSVLAGTEVCQARCPFCISRQTGFNGVTKKSIPINVRNLKKAYTLAWRGGVDTLIITGKGEPTLYPQDVTTYMEVAKEQGADFPFIELQTNGLMLMNEKSEARKELPKWYELGMTTILLSISHYDPEKNRQIYVPQKKEYIDIAELAKMAKDHGLNVRLCCVGLDQFIDSGEQLGKLLEFARQCGIDQVTWRPVNAPDKSEDPEVFEWTQKFFIKKSQHDDIVQWVKRRGTMIRKLVHGAAIFDVDGQNLCLTSCLTHDPEESMGRQLIFFPDGRLYSDWQYKGSILLS